MSALFSPLQIKSLSLKNRLVVSPMCQYSAQDGLANDWHLVHLGSFAVGGAGLIITEATAVSPEGCISNADIGLWNDEQVAPLKRITSFIEAQGGLAGVQLAHAGRKAKCGMGVIGPSAIPFKDGEPMPLEMSADQITQVIQDFKAAAVRALKAGFKVIEIHAAHGYLIHSFLSPLSNHRTDNYGGSFANRTRLLLEIVRQVNEVWPKDLPIFVRISSTDWVDNGWNVHDSIALAALLKGLGVDLIDCSTGGNVAGATIPVGPLYQLKFATDIKKASGILTGAVGMITTAEQGEKIIQSQEADLVFMGREFLRNPFFPLQAAKALKVEVKWPVQYERARG